jgi:mannan endo-1,4-beta-mannosidase
VIPTLENGMPHCTQTGPNVTDVGRWYSDSYRRAVADRRALSLPDYAARITEHYRDEPAILGWMIMNEAETENVPALYELARDVSSRIKRVDPNHLVTLGTQSSGQDGARGQDFVHLYSLPALDFVSGHDWSYWGDDRDPLPGSLDGRFLPDPATCDNYRAIGCSIAQTLTILDKPFVMSEAGIKAWPRSRNSSEERAALLAAKMDAALFNGVAGYLVWQWAKVIDEGYDVRDGDPLLPLLRRRATWLAGGPPPARPGA